MKVSKGILISIDSSDLKKGKFFNDQITEVADNCFYNLDELVSVELPKCKTIGNYCFRYNASLTTVTVPVLTQCGNYCFSSNASLTTVTVPVLTQCGNYCFSYNASLTTVTVPVLTQCGNDCFSSNASLTTVTVPVLTQCGNYCFSSNASLTTVTVPVLTQCGNYCFSYNASLTTVTVPVLTQCGNDCFSSNASLTTVTVPVLTQCGNYCFSSNASLTTVTVGKNKLTTKNVDGYCFVIENEKTSKGIRIYSGYNFVSMNKKKIEKDVCFVAEKEGFMAHGETIRKAVSDLQFKIVAEKLKKEPINKDTKFTVKYYRLLTGACDFGVRSWMTANGVPFDVVNRGNRSEETVERKPMTAKELLPLLEKSNAYGLDKIKQLITF